MPDKEPQKLDLYPGLDSTELAPIEGATINSLGGLASQGQEVDENDRWRLPGSRLLKVNTPAIHGDPTLAKLKVEVPPEEYLSRGGE